MNPRTQLAVAAAGVTLLSSTALHAVFVDNGWVAPVVGAVLAVLAGAELGSRLGQHLVARAVWRFVGSALGTLFYATAVWAHQGAVLGFIPRGHTWHLFRLLFDRAFSEVHDQATPAHTYKALMLLTAVGVAAVAIAVDQLSVRAPLIGLPLLALYSVPEWLSKDGTGWIPLALGGGGYVGLLIREGRDRTSRWGRTVTGATTLGRNRSAAAAMSQAGWRIGAVALGTALVVPPLIPNLGHFNLAKGGGVSPSAVISYNLTANLFGGLHSNTQIPVYSYVSSTGAGEYLRLAESDTFVGDGFSAPTPVADPGVDPTIDPLVTGFGAAAGNTTHQTSIAITGQFNQKELPIPVGTTAIANLQGQWAYQRQSTTVFAASPSTKNQGYSTTATAIDPAPETLQKSSLTAADRLAVAADLRLPADLPAAVNALAVQVTKGATTQYEKAVALQDWFTDKKKFSYSLVGPSNGKNYQALLTFLTVTHSGFCQQFSSAMAVMARSLGIPARVAFGFTSGIPDPNRAGTFHVNSQDGHAWPELYFSGLGWLRFEPTPRDDGQTEKPGYGRYTLDQVKLLGKGNEVIAPGPSPTRTSVPQDRIDRSNARDHTPGSINGSGSWLPVSGSALLWSVVTLVLLALVALLPVLNSMAHRRRRRNTGVAKEVALLAWRETLRDAFDLGHLTSVADSPRQTAQRISDSATLSDSASSAMNRLARAVERARYAPFAGNPQGLLDDAREVSAAMYSVAPKRAKLRSKMLPPSTTLAIAENFSRTTSAVSRWGGRLADRLSALSTRVTGRGSASTLPPPPSGDAADDEARLVRTGS